MCVCVCVSACVLTGGHAMKEFHGCRSARLPCVSCSTGLRSVDRIKNRNSGFDNQG